MTGTSRPSSRAATLSSASSAPGLPTSCTATGRPDGDMPAELMDHYLNSDFGIYAKVVTGGTIRTGDEVEIL